MSERFCCPGCGYEIDGDQTFCPKCGQEIDADRPYTSGNGPGAPGRSADDRKSHRTAVLVLLFLGAVPALISGLVLI